MPILKNHVIGLFGILLFLLSSRVLCAAEPVQKIYTPLEMPVHEETLHGDVIFYSIATFAVAGENQESPHLISEEMWLKPDDEDAPLRPFALFQAENRNVVYDRTTLFCPVDHRCQLAREYAELEDVSLEMETSEVRLIVFNDAGRVEEIYQLETFGLPVDKITPTHVFQYNEQGECLNFKTYNNEHVFAESQMEYEDGRLGRIQTNGYYGPSKTDLVYDENGRLSKLAFYDSLKAESPYRFEHYSVELDEYGNCIRREVRRDDTLLYVEEREIVYAGMPLPEKVAHLQSLLKQDPVPEAQTPVPVMPQEVVRTPIVDSFEEEYPAPLNPMPNMSSLEQPYVVFGPVKRIVQTGGTFLKTVITWERNPTAGKLYTVSQERVDSEYKEKTTWLRDDNGRLREKRIPGAIKPVTRFVYDNAGRLIEVLSGIKEPHMVERRYEYDEAGRMVKQTTLDSDDPSDEPESIEVYYYDQTGNLIRETAQDRHAKHLRHSKDYVYNDDGTDTEIWKKYDENGAIIQESVSTCFPDEKRVEFKIKDSEGRTHDETFELRDGIQTHHQKRPIRDDLFLTTAYQNTLNPEELAATTMLNDRITVNRTETRYDFDVHGNWTEQRIYKNGRLQGQVTREIEYGD